MFYLVASVDTNFETFIIIFEPINHKRYSSKYYLRDNYRIYNSLIAEVRL